MCSPNLAYNLLMLSPRLAIVDAAQPALRQMLERAGIRCIPLQCQHLSPFGGAFHCFTLDTQREQPMMEAEKEGTGKEHMEEKQAFQ